MATTITDNTNYTLESTPIKEENVTEVTIETETTKEVDHFQESLNDVFKSLSLVMSTVKSLQSQLKVLQKQHDKQIKTLKKKSTRRKNNANKNPRKPSGFAKPTQVSDELCIFLGEETGTLLARTDVTKRITKYISDNDLQDPSFRQRILPNESLSKLLNITGDEQLTYFNLQKFIKHHYISSSTT